MNDRESRPAPAVRGGAAFDNLHEWVLSLPWVVERPFGVGTTGVRSFAIECEPLGRRQLWLITGLLNHRRGTGDAVAVILPREAAIAAEVAGLGRQTVPMPADHVLVVAYDDAGADWLRDEALVLSAYSHTMS